MTYCTRCKEEYINGIKRCRVCGDALIDKNDLIDENEKRLLIPKKEKIYKVMV